jgi:hypothetical protein
VGFGGIGGERRRLLLFEFSDTLAEGRQFVLHLFGVQL